jgi:3-hexulose-6-phosphate synthase
MKLQIVFDQQDLETALTTAHEVAEHADILEVGTPLLLKYGVEAVKTFSQSFKDKHISVDSKIVDYATQAVNIFADTGAAWLTVLAGSPKETIRTVCTVAHNQNKKIMIDLTDASSLGQSALEAQSLGADGLVFRQQYDDTNKLEYIENWELVRGNTKLPLFISAQTTVKGGIEALINLKPQGIIIGAPITQTTSPGQKAAYYRTLTI